MARADTVHIDYPDATPDPGYDAIGTLPHRPPDARISYGEHADQYGLLWLAERAANGSAPLIVLVHGGCWLKAYNLDHTRALATALASEGYPVWNLEYRRADEHESAWPTSLQDLQRGLAAASELARYGVDARHVILVGHSAGGHLALLLAGTARDFIGDNLIVSAIGLAAITDIATYATGDNSCQQAALLFMGDRPDAIPDAYAAADPSRLPLDLPGTLLHGDQDAIVPRSQLDSLAGQRVTRLLEPGAGHFDWVHPGTPAYQSLLAEIVRHSAQGSKQ